MPQYIVALAQNVYRDRAGQRHAFGDEPFELPADEAAPWVKTGLLKAVKGAAAAGIDDAVSETGRDQKRKGK